LDINPKLVEYCRALGLDARVMDVDELPLEAASADSALLDNVLEHIAEPQPLLGEIHRVLRLGGVFVVGVPGVKGWHSDPDHKVFYDKRMLVQTVQAMGFDFSHHFFLPWFESDWLSRRVRQYFVYAVFRKSSP
jgi:SAM-dependent methyltransferase